MKGEADHEIAKAKRESWLIPSVCHHCGPSGNHVGIGPFAFARGTQPLSKDNGFASRYALVSSLL